MTKQHIVYCHEIFSACVYNEEKVFAIYLPARLVEMPRKVPFDVVQVVNPFCNTG